MSNSFQDHAVAREKKFMEAFLKKTLPSKQPTESTECERILNMEKEFIQVQCREMTQQYCPINVANLEPANAS